MEIGSLIRLCTDDRNQSRELATEAVGISGSRLVATQVRLVAWVLTPAYYDSRNHWVRRSDVDSEQQI
jgi:hypothetical protein